MPLVIAQIIAVQDVEGINCEIEINNFTYSKYDKKAYSLYN